MARSEVFIKPPHSAHVNRKNMPITMMDRQLAAMRLQQEEASARIESETELARELFDFTHLTEVDEYGFPHSTRYQVPDSVPDVYVPQEKTSDTPQAETKVEVSPTASGDPQPE